MAHSSSSLPREDVYFIDFEAYQHGDEDFHIKELCIMSADNPLKFSAYIFNHSCHWDHLSVDQRKTYRFQYKKLHQIAWNEGDTIYSAWWLQREIELKYVFGPTVFYVLGHQKAKYLQQQLPRLTILDYSVQYNVLLMDLPAPPSYVKCVYREHARNHCAVLKCYRLCLHFRNYVAIDSVC